MREERRNNFYGVCESLRVEERDASLTVVVVYFDKSETQAIPDQRHFRDLTGVLADESL